MNLLGGWNEALDRHREAQKRAAAHAIVPARLDPPVAAGAILGPLDAAGAEDLLARLASTPCAAIALACLWQEPDPGWDMRSGDAWHDIRARSPVALALAAWLTTEVPGEPDVAWRAVLDLRAEGVGEVLGRILRLRGPVVVHDAKPVLFVLWGLGLDPVMHQLVDTRVAAASLHLGLGHRRSLPCKSDAAEQIRGESDLASANERRISLAGQCEHYGIGYFGDPFGAHAPTTDERLAGPWAEGLCAQAQATLKLYASQQPDILRSGLYDHLHQVEFPFVVANARIEWNGVHVDAAQLDLVQRACSGAAHYYEGVLARYGIDQPGSRWQFFKVMGRAGLLDQFRRDGALMADDGVLDALESLHPAIGALRMHRRYSRIAREDWLKGVMTGVDGRIHPTHSQLGAATGRNSCSTPNIAGIGRVLRPVVTAPPSRGLVELDYEQIEVGVAAAEHGDADLIAAFNSGDVYAAMAQRFYAGDLADWESSLSPRDFKRHRPDLRDRMKVFVLAVIYNIQPPALAARFEIDTAQAARERERFLDLFPTLKYGLEASAVYGASRGYASVVSGLRRHVEDRGAPSFWRHNALRNTPIQGSAAVVFKRAVVDIDRVFRCTSARIVLPLHDAVLIECDLHDLDLVAERAARVMKDAVRAYYPALEPRVAINKAFPQCWNKDGQVDSIERFIEDPTYRIERGPEAQVPAIQAAGTMELPASVSDWPADAREAYEERAAIQEYDGGLGRNEAETLAEAAIRSRVAAGGVA